MIMISGVGGPVGTLLLGFEYAKLLKKTNKFQATCLKICFGNLEVGKVETSGFGDLGIMKR